MLILVCGPCSPKHFSRVHTSRGSPSIFYKWWVCHCFILNPYVQIPYCRQSTKRAYLSLSSFGDWWQWFCRLIMCIEHFRHIMSKHKTIWCPSKTIEDDLSLLFFLVDLSCRKAVLLRGGPRWKGLGGISHTCLSLFAPPFLWLFGPSSVFPCICKMKDS